MFLPYILPLDERGCSSYFLSVFIQLNFVLANTSITLSFIVRGAEITTFPFGGLTDK